MTTSVLITGANGFVGKAFLKALNAYKVVALGRTAPDNQTPFVHAELTKNANYQQALQGINVVVHLAARVHVMNEQSADPLTAFREINVFATLNLARQAASAGVKRFVFISSIKVNGEFTELNNAFTAFDQPAPADAYGCSKAEAEQQLTALSLETGMELVIIRPPLVYGPGVKANFAAMLKLAAKNLPLPLGAIKNKRSMVALDNLISLMVICLYHPNAANQIFLVSDDHDVSTTKLLKLMVKSLGKSPRLIPVPMNWFKLVGKITGKQAIVDRLCGNLQVDISHTKDTLGWQPPITVEEGIARCLSNASD